MANVVNTAPGGVLDIYPWVGRCGPASHTLTMFKTNIADFPTLFKTEFRFLIPCLRHLTRNHTLSYLIHWQSQQSNEELITLSIRSPRKDILFKTKIDKSDTLIKTKIDKFDTLCKTKIPKNIPWLAARPH